MNSITFKNHSSYRKILIILSVLFTIWIANAKAQTYPAGFSQQMVESGFNKPTQFAFAPDGRIFVAEQPGSLRVVKNGNLLVRPFIKLSVSAVGERGLLGVAVDPDFNNNHYLYLYYTLASKTNNRISRFTASGDTVVPGSETVVLDLDSLKDVNHNGGFLQFGLDGKLYVCAGENKVSANAQNLDKYLGKILRINTDGSVPPGNPFATGSPQRQRIWAYGMRNPYTIAVQPGTGKIFVNDVGASSWEEVNDCTTGGNNYGWPSAEGMSTNPSYTNPIYTYPHGAASGQGCAITGGTFFNPTSTNYPSAYFGKYFFLDYCNNWIDMLTINGTTVTRSNFATGLPSYSVGMEVGPDGNIYYLSRSTNAIYKIMYGTNAVKTRLNPVADAYIRGGAYVNTNYGKVAALYSQVNASAASNYETFLKFDLTSFSGAISSAILRLYGGLNTSTIPSLLVEAHNSSNISWIDTTITWNNKPVADTTVLATATISGITKEYYQWDLTSQIIALKIAGATSVTIKLNCKNTSGARAIFNSKDATGFRPQLVIIYAPLRMMDTTQPDANVVQDFDIYPNPAGSFFNITLKNMTGDAFLNIYDIKGQLVMKKKIEDSNQERIDTDKFENGLYLVSIANGSGIITKKVILNKGRE